jgi:hypothetical protein
MSRFESDDGPPRSLASLGGISRGKNGKVRRSFGFARAFARGGDSGQRSGVGERTRTGANACANSTSWG